MSISMILILAEVRQLCLLAKLRVWSRVKNLDPVPSLWCIEVLLILSVSVLLLSMPSVGNEPMAQRHMLRARHATSTSLQCRAGKTGAPYRHCGVPYYR